MMMTISASACLLLLSLPALEAGSGTEWTYSGDLGPSHWHKDYADCGGVTQSPINIDTKNVLYNPRLRKFDLSEFSKTSGVTMHLMNKGGHTAEVDFGGDQIRLRGGSLPDNYVLSQFHFHWGSASRRGSEHTLDSKQFPMELHLVHYQDHLKNISAAAHHPNGLAVLGYFFKVGKHNKNFDQLLKHFPKIQKKGHEHVDIETFPLLDLLPSPTVDFFRYDGSLTTPPCFETVIWSLSTTPIEIAEEQIKIFRTLYDSENHPLVDDFRPIQPLNYRTVTVTLKSYMAREMDHGAGAYVTSSTALISALLALSLLLRL